jgi:MazG family protein
MNFSWIIENELMISSAPETPKQLAYIKEAGIRAIVSTVDIPITGEEFGKMGLERLKLLLSEKSAPNLVQLKEFIQWASFMRRAKQPVMIHCGGGKQRSATLAACYLVIFKGFTAENAIGEIREIRGDDCITFSHFSNFVSECEYVKPLLLDNYDQEFHDATLVVDILRRRCPWDKEQTPVSMMQNLLEETYEVWEAVESRNNNEIASELGDVLLQVLMVSRMLSETSTFSVSDVTKAMIAKLINRHPHVFGDSIADTASTVLGQWNQLKDKEVKSIRDIPKSLPPLGRAELVMSYAKKLGFDWPEISGVLEKLDEEVAELKDSIVSGDKSKIEAELGDVIFSILNLARFLDISPEKALASTLAKFEKRFLKIEEHAISTGIEIHTMTLEQMDAIWNEAKHGC